MKVYLSSLMLLFCLAGCVSVDIPLFTPRGPLEEVVVREGAGKYKVLIVDVDGVISDLATKGLLSKVRSSVEMMRERLEMAREDRRVKAVVLRINSPGGGVTASDIMYEELRRFKEKTGVPIIACFMDTAASGGYYIAMSADKIVCHPTCVTGSIGVIAQLASIDKLLDKLGIEPVVVKSGKHKDMGSPLRAPTGAEKKIMQAIIDAMYNRFVDKVAAGRGMEREKVLELADGRVFDAQEAKKLGLVDRLGYLDDAIAMAQAAAKIKDATVVMYRGPHTSIANIYTAEARAAQNVLTGKLFDSFSARFFYLWIPGK